MCQVYFSDYNLIVQPDGCNPVFLRFKLISEVDPCLGLRLKPMLHISQASFQLTITNLDLSDVGPLSSNNKADTVFGYFHLRPVLKYS